MSVQKIEAHEHKDRVKQHSLVFWQNTNASLPGLLFGYTLGSLNTVITVIIYLNQWQDPDEIAFKYSIMTAAFPFGAVVGPLLVSFLLQQFHQHLRKFFMFLDILAILALIIQIIKPEMVYIIIARLIIGFVIGNNSASIPVYIREFSPKQDMGLTGSIMGILISIGVILIYLIGNFLPNSDDVSQPGFTYSDEVTWRAVMGVPIIFCLLRTINIICCYQHEIPSVMIHEHHLDELEHYFREIYDEQYWKQQLEGLEKEVEEMDKADGLVVDVQPIKAIPPIQQKEESSSGQGHEQSSPEMQILEKQNDSIPFNKAQKLDNDQNLQNTHLQQQEQQHQPQINQNGKVEIQEQVIKLGYPNESNDLHLTDNNGIESHVLKTNRIELHDIEFDLQIQDEIKNLETYQMPQKERGDVFPENQNQPLSPQKENQPDQIINHDIPVVPPQRVEKQIELTGNLHEGEQQNQKQEKSHTQKENKEFINPFNLSYKRRLILVFIMAIGNQFSGIGVLSFYSNTIFEQYDKKNAFLYSLCLSLYYLIVGFVSIKLVNVLGRRQLMLEGNLCMIVGLILIIIFSEVESFEGLYVSILIHGAGYFLGVGGVSWLYIAELMNPKGVAIFSFIYWINFFVIGLTTPYMIQDLDIKGTFGIFLAFSIVLQSYLYFEMKESQGKSKQQMAVLFCRPDQIPRDLHKKPSIVSNIDFQKFLQNQQLKKQKVLSQSMPIIKIN